VPDDVGFVGASQDSTKFLPRYQGLARELNINIVPGTICEVTSRAGAPTGSGRQDFEMYNMAYFVAAGTGEVVGTYQKKNLWHPERPHLTSSDLEPHAAFDTPLARADGRPLRAGMLVCWDLAFPEAFRELVADGADLVVIPSFWHVSDVDPRGRALNPDSEKVFLRAATVARAFENTCAIAFCNSGGCSAVAMPILGALGELPPPEEMPDGEDKDRMSIVEVDLDVLRVAEDNYKVRQDMKGEAWHYAHTLVRGEKKPEFRREARG